jgi:hypothetical protein
MKMTVTQLKELNPCEDGLDFVRSCRSLAVAWEKCERADWMLWLLRRLEKMPKEVSVIFARFCADSAKNHAAFVAANASTVAANASTVAANASTVAAYAAAADRAARADRATYATYANAAAERKKQADFLRTLMSNPFKGTSPHLRPAKKV